MQVWLDLGGQGQSASHWPERGLGLDTQMNAVQTFQTLMSSVLTKTNDATNVMNHGLKWFVLTACMPHEVPDWLLQKAPQCLFGLQIVSSRSALLPGPMLLTGKDSDLLVTVTPLSALILRTVGSCVAQSRWCPLYTCRKR